MYLHTWEVEKSKLRNHNKWGPKNVKKVSGQLWFQNSNWIAFDPLYGKKNVENGRNRVFCPFSAVFWPKRGQMLGIRFEF